MNPRFKRGDHVRSVVNAHAPLFRVKKAGPRHVERVEVLSARS